MALTTRDPETAQPQRHTLRRLWKAPISAARWYWLAASIALYIGISAWYFYTLKTQQYPGPINDPLRLFGILAYVLVLGTAIYSLRRRFIRSLPGRVQDWLWMHTWFGIASVLIVFMHENYARITHEYCLQPGCLRDEYLATGALYALILLVVSGIAGRLLDNWQTRIIAREASGNGVGISRTVEARLLELEYSIERYCAGKSDDFKSYCARAMRGRTRRANGAPEVMAHEQSDLQRVQETLTLRARLTQSLHRQRRAQNIIVVWRGVHIVIAILALLIISYHAIMELLANVLHIIIPA
ncbi:MAG: hypothetical protein NVS2B12_16540 [Ktedonobacteraceae bacterium]